MKRQFVIGLLWFCCCSLMLAQTDVAGLSGRITDASGAVVAGAQVTVADVATGVKNTVKTNESGTYSFSALHPGNYKLTAQAQGFQTTVRAGIVLHVQERMKVDLALKVGSTVETVEVTGEVPPLNTESAAVATTVNRDFVANMPLNGRSIQSLISLTPSVVATPVSSHSPGQFSMNGQRADSNYFTVDGVSANVSVGAGASVLAGASGSGVQPSASGGFSNLAPVDSIQEFTIQTSTFAPEFGRTPGGQVSIVTRTGTNNFHGDVFEYLRNNVFDANDWFLNATPPKAGVPQHPPERQNIFGGVIGGPIWKNKAFFFFSYEGTRLTQPTPLLKYVPSLCARGTGPCPVGATPAVAAVRPYLNAYPQPTEGGCGSALPASKDPLLSPFCQGTPNTITANSYSLRGDYSATHNLNLFVKWVHSPSNSRVRGTGNATSVFVTEPDWTSWTAGTTYTFSPALLNDFRFNYSVALGFAQSELDHFGGAVPISDSDPVVFPQLTLPNGTKLTPDNTRFFITYSPASAWRDGEETKNEAHQLNFVDTMSWTHGTHQLKFGTDFRKLTPIQGRAPYQQSYTFTTTAQMNTGKPFRYLSLMNPYAVDIYHQLSLFAQDTWKLTPRLTLTYGLRWEYNPPPGTTNGTPFLGFNQLDYNNVAATQVAPIGSPIYRTEWNALAPRIGIAYQLSASQNWGQVLRAGWGIFYDTMGDYSNLSTVNGPTFTFSQTGAGATTVCGPAVFPANACQQDPRNVNPDPNQAPWTSIIGFNPNARLPKVYQLSAAIEQSLGANQTLTLTYAGAIGRRLFVVETFAGANPNLPEGFQAITNHGSSDYHSLQALFQRRLSKGLQAMASYTWSHSIDTNSDQAYTIPNIAIDPITNERGDSDFDIRHSFQTAISYNIPSPAAHGVVHAVFGNWGTDFLYRARTAPPINITTSKVNWPEFSTENINKRVDIVPGQPFFVYGTACASAYGVPACPGGMALNKAAFANPSTAPGVQGSYRRNLLRGFPFNQLDMTIRRKFPIHESIDLQFRAEMFNVLNHPSFGLTGNSLNYANANFGTSAATLNNSMFLSGTVAGFNPLYQIGGPRSLQLSLKLDF